MKAQWKDYKYGSWLVLVFGQVTVKVVELGPNVWGILPTPGNPSQFTGSLELAQKAAEQIIETTLTAALAALKGPAAK